MAFYAGGKSEKYKQKVNQGDSYGFTVGLQNDETGEIIPFEDGDIIRYTIKKDYKTSVITLQKVVSTFTTAGKAEINVSSSDTNDIEVGRYVYDIELTKNDGQVITIIPDSSTVDTLPTMEICPQVTTII